MQVFFFDFMVDGGPVLRLALRSTPKDHDDDDDLEPDPPSRHASTTPTSSTFKDLIKQLDRGFSGRRHSFCDRDKDPSHSSSSAADDHDVLAESAPPEWALLLIGCLLGLASGLCVALFTKGSTKLLSFLILWLMVGLLVHVIHEYVWARTPIGGAAWLQLQRLADTWHRILFIPLTGGVIVEMMHGVVEILNQIRQSSGSLERQGFDLLAGVFPIIKANQAAVTLGTGCSLGPEGPSVDIGKSCATGISLMMENNREMRIALVAAGAAAGISSGKMNFKYYPQTSQGKRRACLSEWWLLVSAVMIGAGH